LHSEKAEDMAFPRRGNPPGVEKRIEPNVRGMASFVAGLL